MSLFFDSAAGESWEEAVLALETLPLDLALPPAASPPPPAASAAPQTAARPAAATAPAPAKRIGVSFHKGRYDAQAWVGGRQRFVGAYTHEDVAATAHDVAVVSVNGPEAGGHTNAPLACYAPELEAFAAAAASGGADVEMVVQALRARAKQLGKVRAAPVPALAPWELELSAFVHGYTSLGVYASEAEAARAVDRGLLLRDGLAAAAQLNYPLSDYLHLLDAAQVVQAVVGGLLPPSMLPPAALEPLPVPARAPAPAPAALAPVCTSAVQPRPLHHEPAQPAEQPAPALAPIACQPAAAVECGTTIGDAGEWQALAPPAPRTVQRKASTTPRGPAAGPFAP